MLGYDILSRNAIIHSLYAIMQGYNIVSLCILMLCYHILILRVIIPGNHIRRMCVEIVDDAELEVDCGTMCTLWYTNLHFSPCSNQITISLSKTMNFWECLTTASGRSDFSRTLVNLRSVRIGCLWTPVLLDANMSAIVDCMYGYRTPLSCVLCHWRVITLR